MAEKPIVGIVMGSKSDWETMRHAADTFDQLKVIPYEKRILSAHRTPDAVTEYAKAARERGIKIIIAGAGGAAHLPGKVAPSADHVPVIGVPVPSKHLQGMDSLLSIVQMPAGIPVHTMAIGKAGAINAALSAAEMLAITDKIVLEALRDYRRKYQEQVKADDEELQGR
jgi:5-(carboxyamino)imidazole ribonucleotide mutase